MEFTKTGLHTMESPSQSGPEENGGIFSAGTYHYTIFDTAGDTLDGNAAFHFETRAVGSTGAYTTIHSEIGTFIGSSGLSGTITVPSGQEMILAYNCPGTSNCWPTENYMTITPEVIPTIPAAAAGVGGAAPVQRLRTCRRNILQQVMAEKHFLRSLLKGSSPGDADETEIYYRIAGSTGWIDKWDICSISDSSCNSATTYDSHLANPPILFQTPATYELLVWDTAGDGSGIGAGGTVVYTSLGSTTGVIQNNSQTPYFQLNLNQQINPISPLLSGGNPVQWEISPTLQLVANSRSFICSQ